MMKLRAPEMRHTKLTAQKSRLNVGTVSGSNRARNRFARLRAFVLDALTLTYSNTLPRGRSSTGPLVQTGQRLKPPEFVGFAKTHLEREASAANTLAMAKTVRRPSRPGPTPQGQLPRPNPGRSFRPGIRFSAIAICDVPTGGTYPRTISRGGPKLSPPFTVQP